MIFATTGTSMPFDRLLAAFDELELDEELVVQYGASPVRPRGAHCVDFLAYSDLVDLVRRARVVVTHAGVGSILSVLSNGKRPIVVPRRAEHGEAVDDHQVEFGRSLAAAGLVTMVEDPAGLPAAVATAPTIPAAREADGRLAGEISAYLRSRLRPTAGAER